MPLPQKHRQRIVRVLFERRDSARRTRRERVPGYLVQSSSSTSITFGPRDFHRRVERARVAGSDAERVRAGEGEERVEEIGERRVRPELDVPVGAVRKVVVTEVGSVCTRLQRRCQFFQSRLIY